MNYIITKNKKPFEKLGKYRYCDLEDMKLSEVLAIDTETTALKPMLGDMFCIQIGTGRNNYIIQLYDNNYEFKDVIPYLEDKRLVFHNAQFDLAFFYKHDYFPRNIGDSMIASKIYYNGQFEEIYGSWRPIFHDFGSCMRRELEQFYDKTTQKNIHIVKLSQATAIQYSFNDVDRLLELEAVLIRKLQEIGAMDTYRLHCQAARVLAYMEMCGLPINPEKWKAKMDVDYKKMREWETKIEEYIYNTLPQFADKQLDMFDTKKRILVKLTSPKQMIQVFNAYGINTKDKDGKDSIKEDIISKSKHPFVGMWLKFQNAKHRVTTFGDGIYQQIVDNRVYTSFNPMVDTARLSSRRGNINFLNFPADKETRECFETNDEHHMIVCDWSGQETVLAADLSGDEAMTKSVVEGADLHCLLARVLFPELEDLTDEEIVTHHKAKRTASKAPRFAMSYGGNAYTLHVNEGIPMDRALEIEIGFKDLHAGLYEWGNMVFVESVSTGFIESVDGWRLKLPKYDAYLKGEKMMKQMSKEDWTTYRIGKIEYKKLKDDPEYKTNKPYALKYYRSKAKSVSDFFKLKSEYQRLCLNNPVQTRGAHQLKLALVKFFDWILDNGYVWKVKICNAVHDEIVAEAIKDLALETRDELKSCMITAGNHYLEDLTIKADPHVGSSWYEAK